MSETSVEVDAPHMQAIMKSAKITPCGGGVLWLARAGVQLKMNANIDPSKDETMMPSSKVRESDSKIPDAIFKFSMRLAGSPPDSVLPKFSSQVPTMSAMPTKRHRIARSKGAQ